jgi:hypothetical protein
VPLALVRIEQEMTASPAVAELVAFIRQSKRGIGVKLARGQADAA